MDVSVKYAACEAMGKNFFTKSAINEFLSTSTYKVKEKWVEKVQKIGEMKEIISAWDSHVSRQKRKAFKELRVIQLRDFISNTSDEQLLKYQRMQLAFFDDKASGDFAKLQNLLFKTEEKLIARYSEEPEISLEDLRKFLFTAVLCSPNAHQYSWGTKGKALELCARLS